MDESVRLVRGPRGKNANILLFKLLFIEEILSNWCGRSQKKGGGASEHDVSDGRLLSTETMATGKGHRVRGATGCWRAGEGVGGAAVLLNGSPVSGQPRPAGFRRVLLPPPGPPAGGGASRSCSGTPEAQPKVAEQVWPVCKAPPGVINSAPGGGLLSVLQVSRWEPTGTLPGRGRSQKGRSAFCRR